MLKKILIANRGAIAARILRACKELNIQTVVIYSEADAQLPYIKQADESYVLPGNAAKDTYLNQEKILEIVKQSGVDGVHPGYGFLAENLEFAEKLEQAGVTFIAPSSKYIKLMADKSDAREEMAKYTMPIGKGSGPLPNDGEEILAIAEEIGFPILVKPANGGGGIGMFPVYEAEKLVESVEKARGLSKKFFSSDVVYLERYLEKPRHIEFQIVADRNGRVKHLYERDCSLQRRHQKIIEESPAPNIDRQEIEKIARQVEESIQQSGYDNVGTVELLRGSDGTYSFLEMNTRLQVEHAVTEQVLNVDLVKLQIASASGEKLETLLPTELQLTGHAIEVRIYAEDPVTFYPAPGTLQKFSLPEASNIRVETGFEEGNTITPFYDPMIAKIIATGENRTRAIEILKNYLTTVEIIGVKTNIPFLQYALQSEEFSSGNVDTGLADVLVKRMKEELKK